MKKPGAKINAKKPANKCRIDENKWPDATLKLPGASKRISVYILLEKSNIFFINFLSDTDNRRNVFLVHL